MPVELCKGGQVKLPVVLVDLTVVVFVVFCEVVVLAKEGHENVLLAVRR